MGTSGCGENTFNIEPFSPGSVRSPLLALRVSAADCGRLCVHPDKRRLMWKAGRLMKD